MKRERLLTAVLLVIAAAALSGQTTEPHIWSLDLLRLALRRLMFGPDASRAPLWTPDGRRVLFNSGVLVADQ